MPHTSHILVKTYILCTMVLTSNLLSVASNHFLDIFVLSCPSRFLRSSSDNLQKYSSVSYNCNYDWRKSEVDGALTDKKNEQTKVELDEGQ